MPCAPSAPTHPAVPIVPAQQVHWWWVPGRHVHPNPEPSSPPFRASLCSTGATRSELNLDTKAKYTVCVTHIKWHGNATAESGQASRLRV